MNPEQFAELMDAIKGVGTFVFIATIVVLIGIGGVGVIIASQIDEIKKNKKGD